MTDKKYDYSYYAYKRNTKQKASHKKSIVFSIVISIAIILIATFFYTSLQNKMTVFANAQTCYAVSLGQFDSQTDADSYAKIVSSRGGAGYVYKKENYHVLACAYSSKNDADSVCDQLVQNGEEATVVILYTSAKQIQIDGDKTAVDLCHDGIDLLKKAFELCNDFAVQTDQGKNVSLTDFVNQVKNVVESADSLPTGISKQLKKLYDNLNSVNRELTSAGLRYVAIASFLSVDSL